MKIKNINKILIYSSASLIISLLLSFIYIFFPKLPDSLDNRTRDFLFNVRGEIPHTQNIVIIDIDEKSLQSVGQWPWSRNKIAKILESLTAAQAAIIAFDIVFPEVDNSSPHKVLKELNIHQENIPNFDETFAQTVSQTPTILGYQFELEKNKYVNKEAPSIPAIFIEKNKSTNMDYLIKAKGTILNTPTLQQSAYSSGFFNNIPDDSGIIRNVPLVISYNDTIYPSLALETIRIITQSKKVTLEYNNQGVQTVNLKNITIPTDRHGRLMVNFRGKEKSFPYYSAVDILNNNFDKKEIQDKIVLIGTSAAGLLDLRATPFEAIYPGVEVHANVIDNILQGDFIYKTSWIDGANIVIIFLLSSLTIFLISITPFWANPLISLFFIIVSSLFIYWQLFFQGIVLNIFFPLSTIVISAIAATLLDYFYNIKHEEAVKKKFASKVSKEVMDNLLQNLDDNSFQAMEKEVTVFFSDIRGFTQISENMKDAKTLINYLNEYMEPMSNIITKYEGTIDKYIGDAIMAYWNAPGDVKNHADKAVQASLEQINYLQTLNQHFKRQNQPLIDIGIGLNTGEAIVGEMGSIGRSDYTTIGDSINLGARLESLCKYYNSRLNISNFTKKQLKEHYTFRFLDLVTVKGKVEPIEIWQVINKGEAKGALKDELKTYHQAIKLYKDSHFKEALQLFIALEENEDKTNKAIYLIYIQRCKHYIKYPPKNFNGVYEHTAKA